ncbi:MAG: quinone-dependent dihydroorotate dehydrogenase [Actinomycetes bacterium]
MYNLIFKLVFAKLDAEQAHHFVVTALRIGSATGITKLFRSSYKTVKAFGLNFNGPFGIAAGFDKNALLIRPLGDLGFSHVEIGTVTALAQPGNEKPRLFRLVQDRALINRMGFNNDGAHAIARRLGRLRAKYGQDLPIIGVNIGKSKVVDVADAVSDYETSAKLLAPFADYLAVNVSSPNTPGLRSLQEVSALKPILQAVLKQSLGLPVLVKIAPDLNNEDILAIADLAVELGLAGIIATNTTISRQGLEANQAAVAETGGLSGAPLATRSKEVLGILNGQLRGKLAIISVGGVETAQDVKERLQNGATLVQGYTGFIYQGPMWARDLNRAS